MRSPLAASILAIILLALGIAGYAGLYSLIAAKSVAVVMRAHEIEAKSASVRETASIEAALAQIAVQEAVLRSYIVPEADAIALIDDLESRGRAFGTLVEIDSVAFSSPKARPALLFSLTITGAFDTVIRTLGSIEYAPYDLAVTGFTLSQGVEGDPSWIADVELSVGSATSTPSS